MYSSTFLAIKHGTEAEDAVTKDLEAARTKTARGDSPRSSPLRLAPHSKARERASNSSLPRQNLELDYQGRTQVVLNPSDAWTCSQPSFSSGVCEQGARLQSINSLYCTSTLVPKEAHDAHEPVLVFGEIPSYAEPLLCLYSVQEISHHLEPSLKIPSSSSERCSTTKVTALKRLPWVTVKSYIPLAPRRAVP